MAIRTITLRKILATAFAPAILIAGIAATPAQATVLLDQSETTGGWVNFLSSSGSIGQSFTVGVTGILDHIDVHLRKTFPAQGPETDYDIQLSLQSLSGGLPDGISLATATIDGSTLPDAPATGSAFTTFDLSAAGISVTAGDMFAFVLTGLGSSSADWNIFSAGTDENPYAGGAKLSFNGVNWTATNTDAVFQTFVNDSVSGPVAVPEPGMAALVGLGLVGLGFARRRRIV